MRILLCSPYFAEDGLVGTKRMMSLVRFLAEQGHQITVLRHAVKAEDDVEIPGVQLENVSRAGKFKSVLRQYIYERGVYQRAVRKALDRDHFDVLLASMGPFSSCKAICAAHQRKLRCIIDFRDLGVANALIKPPANRLYALKRKLATLLYARDERKAVKAADAITTVTSGDKEIICRRYQKPESQVHVIMNGYDDAVLGAPKTHSAREDGPIRVGYFGKLMYYAPEITKNLLLAINRLRREGQDVRLTHVGDSFESVEAFLEERHCDPLCYEPLGKMKYSDGMRRLENMDINYIGYKHPTGYGTKVFDYIYLNRPILLGVSRGTTALEELLGAFDHAFQGYSEEEMYQNLKKIIRVRYATLDDALDPQRYSRRNQNIAFQHVMEAIGKIKMGE